MKLQRILKPGQSGTASSKPITLILITALVISLTGCNISNSDGSLSEETTSDIKTNEAAFADAGASGKCPVVTGQDLEEVVAPMFHPQVFNVQLRKAEGLLLPAVQAVTGHFKIKICRTLTENYQFEWKLQINNRDGLGFTGWSLIHRNSEDELVSTQFPNQVETGRKVKTGGTREVDGEFLSAPQDYMIVIRTTNNEINLVGLLLPAIQWGGEKYPNL